MHVGYEEVIDIALLYEAGLGRQYDDAGLNYWIDYYEFAPINNIAYNFLVSDEFTFEFGPAYSISTENFVYAMYDNVLGRAPDPGGFNFWADALDDGFYNREEVLISFSQSPENYAESAYVYDVFEVAPGYWDIL